MTGAKFVNRHSQVLSLRVPSRLCVQRRRALVLLKAGPSHRATRAGEISYAILIDTGGLL